MTLFANTTLNSRADMIAAIRALQQYTGQPVSNAIDDQGIGQQVVLLQKYLSTLPDATQPSGFLYDPASVKSNIADHSLPGMIMHLQRLVYEESSPVSGEQFVTFTDANGNEQVITALDNNGFERRITVTQGT
jgi:hypothetical protein